MLRPTGSWVALVTPFTEAGEVDFAGFERLIDFQVEHGTSGLLIMGSTGEPTLLTPDERREILDRVCAYAQGKIPVFAGTTCGSTVETIALSRYAEQAGADGLLLLVPAYATPPQDGIYLHFKAVAEAVSIPIAVYNNPSRVGVNIDPATIIKLAEIPNIVADKEAMGNIGQLVEVLRSTNGRLYLLCCDYPGYGLILPTLALGGHGTANIAGNIIPREMAEMSRPWQSWDDVRRTRELYFKYVPLLSALYSQPNPIAVKAALRLMGLPTAALIAPLTGRFADRCGSKLSCFLGMGMVASAGVSLTLWQTTTPPWQIVASLVALGLGMGLTQSPVAAAVTFIVAKEQLGVALGIFNMFRFISGSLGTTVFGIILQSASSPSNLGTFRLDFYLLIAVASLAALVALGLPGPVACQSPPDQN